MQSYVIGVHAQMGRGSKGGEFRLRERSKPILQDLRGTRVDNVLNTQRLNARYIGLRRGWIGKENS